MVVGKKIYTRKKAVFAAFGMALFMYPLIGALTGYFFDQRPYGYPVGTILSIQSEEEFFPIGEIIEGNVIQQRFVLEADFPILEFRINAATYDRENQGSLIFRLIEAEGMKILKSWNIDVSQMKDNSAIRLGLEDMDFIPSSKRYILEAFSEGGKHGNAVTFYACQGDTYQDGWLLVNGEEQPVDLCFQIQGIIGKRGFLHTKVWLQIYAVSVAEMILYYVYTKSERMERKKDES